MRAREFEAALATMTPREREAAEAQRQLMEEINALPPAERQQRLQQLAGANAGAQESGVLQRMQDRLKNTSSIGSSLKAPVTNGITPRTISPSNNPE